MGQRRRTEDRVSRAWKYWILTGLLVVAAVGAGLIWRAPALRSGTAESREPALSTRAVAPGLPLRETRPTLDPARFVGKAALAHQVAREIPDILDQLYCYCECDKHLGHKSLLSCYTDGHAAT